MPELPATLLAYRREIIVALHVLLVPAIYLLAFALRFDLAIPAPYREAFLVTLALLLPVRLLAFRFFRLYNGWWRHIGMYDLVALVRATSASSLVFVALLFLFDRGADLPRSILVLDWALSILVLGGIRFGVRWMREGGVTDAWTRGGKRTIIIGADDAASRLLREVRLDPTSGIHPVGIVDDDPRKLGYQMHGVPVIGAPGELKQLVSDHAAELVVIATPVVSRDAMRRLVDQCAGLAVEFKIVPPLGELVDGRARLSQLRTVEIEDLLGRDPVNLDMRLVEESLSGKTVLITGGAGSIGSELARQVAALGASRLVLVEKAESPLYFVDLELRRTHPGLEVIPVVADVTNRGRLSAICAEHRPDTVFHAAAYKHVPLMEANVVEAVRNNVLGTLCAAEVAVECGARRFVLISTDKAVRPSSVMGATKRIAERLLLGLPHLRASGTDFRAVRFGNVLGSDGSVIPLFKRQIAAGGPVTVTHPDVTRYFMTIPEAVQLVLEASALPEAAGRISMLDMGEPVRIVDLAENLVRLSGLEPYTEMPIVFTGLRPGEKLFEELHYDVETAIPTQVEKICIVQGEEQDDVAEELGRLMNGLDIGTTDSLLPLVRTLVPECVAPLRDAGQRPVLAVIPPSTPPTLPAGRPSAARIAPAAAR
ncbi:MAG TPA: nucleoside-diphosphate sugar epimerase/dehydratase [Gemmatimonadales bacterium]